MIALNKLFLVIELIKFSQNYCIKPFLKYPNGSWSYCLLWSGLYVNGLPWYATFSSLWDTLWQSLASIDPPLPQKMYTIFFFDLGLSGTWDMFKIKLECRLLCTRGMGYESLCWVAVFKKNHRTPVTSLYSTWSESKISRFCSYLGEFCLPMWNLLKWISSN